MNYASHYIDELGGNAFEDRYYDKQFFLMPMLLIKLQAS
jgi:hypothetical protein